MYNKALAGIVSTAAYLLTVAVACSFPPDHPTISLNDLPAFSETEVYTLISVFTDPFSDCSGCVTEMSACYVVFLGQPTPLSVLIINEDSRITHVYNTVAYLTSSDNQDTNCTVIDQFFTLCCLRQILTPSEQFTVQSNHHFGVWSTEQVHAQQTTTPGYFTEGNISVGDTLTNFEGRETITKSYVYLNITPGDCTAVTPSQVDQPQTTVGEQPQTTIGDQPQTTVGDQPQTTIATESTPSSSHLPAITATSASDITPSSHSTNTTSSNVIKPSSGYSTDSTIIDPTTPTCTTSKHLCPRSTVTPSTSHRSTGHDVRPQTSVSESSTTSATVAVQSSLPELRETDSHTATALLAGATGGGVAVILLAAAVVILGITCTVKMRVNTKKKGNDTCLMEKENNIELSSNTAYTCTNTVAIQEVPVPITTTSNSAYARSGHVSTSDEIYSYIPDESELASSWKSATCIPTSLNDSYTVTTQVKQVPENSQTTTGLLDDDYVVNEPIYATADGDTDLVKSSAAPIEDEYIVNQLVYATAGRDTEAVRPHETSPDKPSIETATNEAYVCSNPATDPVTSNEAHALPVNSSEVYELYDTVLGNIDV